MSTLDIDANLEDANNVRKATKTRMKSESSDNSSVRKKAKPNSNNETEKPSGPRKPLSLETEPSVLHRRQKQIDYGKNTVGYHNYIQLVPIEIRTKDHPKTPDKYAKYSRRSWDSLIKIWRKKLHEYDTQANSDPDGGDNTGDSESDNE